MPTASDKPLVTFAVAAFNQERFIREAVEGAFGQTYSPLEIVLSDDCSRDRTFEIIREMAEVYRGPHKVILNRNPVQKSIGGHINRIMEISHGEMIVGAAGDDISLPERTQAVYEAWEDSGRKATSIHSSFIQIDEEGRTIERSFEIEALHGPTRAAEQQVEALRYLQTLQPIVFGCAHAFSRCLFDTFGPLLESIIHEDNALALRSILVGKLVPLKAPLVRYRLHGNNVFVTSRARRVNLKSLARQEDHLRRNFRNRETMYKGFLLDLEIARQQGLIPKDTLKLCVSEATRRRDRFAFQSAFLESGFLSRCRLLLRLGNSDLDKAEMRVLIRRLLPMPLLLSIRLARSYGALALGRPQ
jgi:glycosyltransferase involved in cell wall biosynthesis